MDAFIETTVLVAGTRSAIANILNRAFRMVASGVYMIGEDDTIEDINVKIAAANKHMSCYKTGFTLMDYMDLNGRMDSPFKDDVLWYIDVEEPDDSENFDANPVKVTTEGDEYTLMIVSSVREGQRTYCPQDWRYWCAMISISDACLISFKKDND